jgi:hypothetical protein
MFIDLALGFIIGTITGFAITGEFYYPYVGAAMLFSLLPDIDFLLYHSFHDVNRMSHRHRRILHYPLIFIPAGAIVVTLFSMDPVYGLMFVIVSLAHFTHDTGWIGYGVQWAYPFNKNHYFFGNKTDAAKHVVSITPKLHVHSDTMHHVDAHAKKHGDDKWLMKKLPKVLSVKKEQV